MVSYKPVRYLEGLPNDSTKITLAVGTILATHDKKEMAICGGKNAIGEFCRMPVFYSIDKSLRDVVCGYCGSEINWDGFTPYVSFCPQCNKERESTLQYCTGHSPAVRLEKREKSS